MVEYQLQSVEYDFTQDCEYLSAVFAELSVALLSLSESDSSE